jgi:hypothetical protein
MIDSFHDLSNAKDGYEADTDFPASKRACNQAGRKYSDIFSAAAKMTRLLISKEVRERKSALASRKAGVVNSTPLPSSTSLAPSNETPAKENSAEETSAKPKQRTTRRCQRNGYEYEVTTDEETEGENDHRHKKQILESDVTSASNEERESYLRLRYGKIENIRVRNAITEPLFPAPSQHL